MCDDLAHDKTIARETRSGPGRQGPAGGSAWGLPVALVLLSLVPVTAGVLRVVEIFGGPLLLPDKPRIESSPAPVGASLAAGFSAIRRRDIVAHRAWTIRAYALGLGAGT